MGLRESKKLQTRQEISDHATRLFMEKGFEATTIAEIAVAARVAKKTVTNYFTRKEDLALDHHEAYVQGLADAVADRPDGESPTMAFGRTLRAALTDHDPVVGFSGKDFAGMIAESPTLTARLRELHDLREAALADALADKSDAPAARTSAALIAAVDRLIFRRIQELTLAGSTDDEITTLLLPEAESALSALERADAREP